MNENDPKHNRKRDSVESVDVVRMETQSSRLSASSGKVNGVLEDPDPMIDDPELELERGGFIAVILGSESRMAVLEILPLSGFVPTRQEVLVLGVSTG